MDQDDGPAHLGLSLPQPWNQLFPQGFPLVENSMQMQLWKLSVPIAAGVTAPRRLSEMCVYTHVWKCVQYMHMYAHSYSCGDFCVYLRLLKTMSLHHHRHLQPNTTGFIPVFSFSVFVTHFPNRELASLILSIFAHLIKPFVYNHNPPRLPPPFPHGTPSSAQAPALGASPPV